MSYGRIRTHKMECLNSTSSDEISTNYFSGCNSTAPQTSGLHFTIVVGILGLYHVILCYIPTYGEIHRMKSMNSPTYGRLIPIGYCEAQVPKCPSTAGP